MAADWPWIDCSICGAALIHGEAVTAIHYDYEDEDDIYYCATCCPACNRLGMAPPDEYGLRSAPLTMEDG